MPFNSSFLLDQLLTSANLGAKMRPLLHLTIQSIVDRSSPSKDDDFVTKALSLAKQDQSAVLGEPLLPYLVQNHDYDMLSYLLKRLSPLVTSPVAHTPVFKALE